MRPSWRDGRVVECTGLENRHGFVAHLGFKSLSLRQVRKTRFIAGFFMLDRNDMPRDQMFYRARNKEIHRHPIYCHLLVNQHSHRSPL
jgi:hypothetical protein